jgi:hypothetical protein
MDPDLFKISFYVKIYHVLSKQPVETCSSFSTTEYAGHEYENNTILG